MQPSQVQALFTGRDGAYRFARWGRPIVPVVFGVDDATLSIVKGAVEAVVTLARHRMAETDPELGANLMVFFFRDWAELPQVPNLDRLVPELPALCDRLAKAGRARGAGGLSHVGHGRLASRGAGSGGAEQQPAALHVEEEPGAGRLRDLHAARPDDELAVGGEPVRTVGPGLDLHRLAHRRGAGDLEPLAREDPGEAGVEAALYPEAEPVRGDPGGLLKVAPECRDRELVERVDVEGPDRKRFLEGHHDAPGSTTSGPPPPQGMLSAAGVVTSASPFRLHP